MATSRATESWGILLDELDKVLERARAEQWRELALIGPHGSLYSPIIKVPETHVFQFRKPLNAESAGKLASLTGLTSLDLTGNEIGAEGARALTALTGLTSLDLDGNWIGAEGARALLDAWCDAPTANSPRFLDLRGNGNLGSVLPLEVLDSRDGQAILAAYRRYRSAQAQGAMRPLNQAKVLVVGNEAVGKTSLIRYLARNQPRNPDEQKTPGIAAHEKIAISTWSSLQSNIAVNIWDFGGQEIMRGTHRFFLTERSLYLLVLEDRREDDRSVYDWLGIIRQFGGDSPVIVVINKCDGEHHQLQLNETRLKHDYPIVGFVRTSCNDNPAAAATVARLRELIATTLATSDRLRHVRDEVPASWLRVRDALATQTRKRSVLPVRDFERLCEGADHEIANQDRINDQNEQRALLRLLHDLGVVVAHGLTRDAPAARREITVLDPNWLTGAIYTLLNSHVVRDQGGELGSDQLVQILDPERYPARWHEFIVSMMQHPDLGLCFQLPGSEPPRYLIPEALPANEPYYGVWPADSLLFRFQYRVLPTGLIPRFIVEAHRNLIDTSTRWRTGVVLDAEGCPILVRGDLARNRIDIKVAGKTGQRAALSIVRNYFAAVHKRYAELDVKAKVPLPRQPDADVGYDYLIRLEQRFGLKHLFVPEDAEGANDSYTVRELLEGVRDEAPRHYQDRAREPAGFAVSAGDGANILNVGAGAQIQIGGNLGSSGTVQMGTGNTAASAPPQTTAQSPDSSAAGSSSQAAQPSAADSSWWKVALASAAAAVGMAVVLYLLPSDRLRAIVGGMAGLGLTVFLVVLKYNPATLYRRLLSWVITAGFLITGAGFTFEGFLRSEPASGAWRWNSNVSGVFYAAWAVIICILAWADKTNKPHG